MDKLISKSLLKVGKDLLKLPQISPTIVEDSNGKTWLLSKAEGNLKIFKNECPHQGHEFRAAGEKFICKGHNWIFDTEGKNLVPKGQNLVEADYSINDFGEIFVHQINCISFENYENKYKKTKNITIEFISHASLRVSTDGFKVMTDPWLTPTTYWGHWKHWPSRELLPGDLVTDAIVITHEHPDHFHPDSLKYFDRTIPIYLPNFISGRIQDALQELEFKKVYVLEFDEEKEIHKDAYLTFIRPSSRWEDSISLIRIDDFTWLNINDAGYLGNTLTLPKRVDLLSGTFDVYASDFPLCWSELSSSKKSSHAKIARNAIEEHLSRITSKFNATYFLPMASFWRLNGLEELEAQMNHVTLDQLKKKFTEKGIGENFLDLHPGESFSFSLNRRIVERKPEERKELSRGHHPDSNNHGFIGLPDETISEDLLASVENYLRNLSDVASAFQCEHVLLRIKSNGKFVSSQEFGLNSSSEGPVTLEIDIPAWLLKELIHNRANFEWIRIGYWAKFKRDKEVYTPNFLRLLAFGANASKVFSAESKMNISEDSLLKLPIMKLMNMNPTSVGRILNRFGLPCYACNKANMETLDQAFSKHNIGKNEQADIIAALSMI